MNKNRENYPREDETQQGREEQLLEEIRNLLRTISVDEDKKEGIAQEAVRAVPTVRDTGRDQISARAVYGLVFRAISETFNQGRLSSQEHERLQRELHLRFFDVGGFRDPAKPHISEARELWEVNRHQLSKEEYEQILQTKIQRELSHHAQDRVNAWIERNKNLIPEWDIRQVLDLKDYPNPDRETGKVKTLYFNKGDQEGEFVDLTY